MNQPAVSAKTQNTTENTLKKGIKKLTELPATAICGNDISSSCLYVSALAILYSGQYAWISLLMVAVVLFFFRNIYGEVVGALPLNGGAYNALLNTTSKNLASMAACLTLLSYMATAVISASEAMHYAHNLWESLPIFIATICLLGVFMLLTILGIGESSKVAIAIFLFHLTSLVLLVGFCGYYMVTHGVSTLSSNWATPVEGGIPRAIFFGFSAAMLGISGFESSANYVEEQADGVFPKTLRNMWIVVTVFNPLIAFLALAIVPIPEVVNHQEALLAHMGTLTGGNWLAYLISVDAALVLSGAVLTSFVGVGGLVQRMTLDRVLPQFLLKLNRRQSPYRIMIAFFLLSLSVLFITRGKLDALAGVYTISFLCVMILFASGNILLKIRRAKLPRPTRASVPGLMIAIIAVGGGLIGNAILNPPYLAVFIEYFIPTMLIVLIMLYRTTILEGLLHVIHYIFEPVRRLAIFSNIKIKAMIEKINSQEFVFFANEDNPAVTNKVMLYVRNNEHTNKIKIVTVVDGETEVTPEFKKDIEVIDRIYPEIDIEFVEIHGQFGPDLIDELSRKWNIPKNFMFIGSPGDEFPYRIEELGGVRLII